MAKLTPAPLLTSTRSIYKDLINATSSQASAAGLMRSASQDGRIADLFGLEVAPASRSRSQAKAPVLTIQGTCGPTFIASSVPLGPLWYWENRLRERLATVGSTEFALIWKEKATPAGAPISQLSRSTPRTFASASTGLPQTWRTPATTEPGVTLERLQTVDGPPWTPGQRAYDKHTGRVAQVGLTHEVLATWPTPTKADGDGGHGMGTASVTGKRENGTKITVSLPGVVKIVSTWPTPRAGETCDQTSRPGFFQSLPNVVRDTEASGPTTSGSPDQTGTRGALNPAFPCWLMGYPTEWDDCAPTATPSSRRSRQK